jgi:hypothetical protein
MISKNSSLFRRVLPRKVHTNSSDEAHNFETVGGVYQDAKLMTVHHKNVMFCGNIGEKLQTLNSGSNGSIMTEPTCAETTISTSTSFDVSMDSDGNPCTGMVPFQWTRMASQRNLFANMSLDDEEEEDSNATSTDWKSSSNANHHEGAPLITLRSESVRLIDPRFPELQLGDGEVLHKILTKAAKNLPRHSGSFCSLHVMINAERVKRQVAPLQRMPYLDELARQQAKDMALKESLQHADLQQWQVSLSFDMMLQGSRVGSNVAACQDGNLHRLFQNQMKCTGDCNNVLDRRYTYMGVGTCKGSDGKLYVCQVFA